MGLKWRNWKWREVLAKVNQDKREWRNVKESGKVELHGASSPESAGDADWDPLYSWVKASVLYFKPFLLISWCTSALKSKWKLWSCPKDHDPHQCPDLEQFDFWEMPTIIWATVAQRKERHCLVSPEALPALAHSISWKGKAPQHNHVYPKLSLKKSTLLGSQEHKPKITGLTLSQGVLIKHENQLISAEGEAKDRSEQIDNISSIQSWTAWLETSFQGETGVCRSSGPSDLPLPQAPPSLPLRKAVCEMLCTLCWRMSQPQSSQTGWLQRVPLKRSSSSKSFPGKMWRRAVEKVAYRRSKIRLPQ